MKIVWSSGTKLKYFYGGHISWGRFLGWLRPFQICHFFIRWIDFDELCYRVSLDIEDGPKSIFIDGGTVGGAPKICNFLTIEPILMTIKRQFVSLCKGLSFYLKQNVKTALKSEQRRVLQLVINIIMVWVNSG